MILPEELTCGFFDCSEFGTLTQSPKRTVTRFEIEYYLADALTTIADDHTYRIMQDYIQIAKPGQIRHSNLPFTTIYIKFHAEGELYETLINAPEYFRAHHSHEIKGLLKEIILLNEAASPNFLQLYSKFLALLDFIIEDSRISQSQDKYDYKIILNARKFIEQNYASNIHLADIAAAANLSQTYFHTIFSATCGMSPHEYLLQYRILKAKEMLWNSDINIGYISEVCGFGCQQHMNLIFKKYLGITPGQYRKQMKQNYLL